MVKVLAKGEAVSLALGAIITLIFITGGDAGPVTRLLPCCHAVSVLNAGPPGGSVTGVLEFRQHGRFGAVTILGKIRGLEPNTKHGFHIHESGDLRNKTNPCLSTGAHFNPYNKHHGGPGDDINHRHVGDLGNIQANANGVAKVNITDHIISLSGPLSIVGRAVMVHALVDDLGKDGYDSLNTGNAGGRVACGVIGIIYEKPK